MNVCDRLRLMRVVGVMGPGVVHRGRGGKRGRGGGTVGYKRRRRGVWDRIVSRQKG